MKGAERELAILTIERLLTHLKKQAAATPGTGPFSPAEAYALKSGLRLIKKTLFPQEPDLDTQDDTPEGNKNRSHAP